MTILFQVTAPVFLLIAAGYILVILNILTDSHIQGVMKYTQGFGIPCLLFFAIMNLDLSIGLNPQLVASFYVGSICCFMLGCLGSRYLFKRDWEDSIAIGFTALFGNTVLLGLPIVERAYGGLALEATFGLVALHAPFCYFIGITAMEIARSDGFKPLPASKRVFQAMFQNALMLGIFMGFIFNLFSIPLPGFARETFEMVAASALPAALFGLGGVLVRYRPDGDMRLILGICTLSLGLHPFIAWLFAGAIFGLEIELLRSAVITSAMAPGINAYIFSSMYERAQRTVASSVVVATAASIFTASVWLLFLA